MLSDAIRTLHTPRFSLEYPEPGPQSLFRLNFAVESCKVPPVITALIIFIITYIFIGLRQIPRMHIDRPAGALVGAVLMIVCGVLTLDQAFAAVDMHTLLLLLGMMIITVYLRLFVVMHAVEVSGLAGAVINRMGDVSSYSSLGKIAGLSGVSLALSNLVSNVPAVMLLKPLTRSLGDGHYFRLALAMSSTLAGNFTLIGSVANLIVAQQARRKVEIGFMEYFRVGALITISTIAIGILVLGFEVRIAHGAEGMQSKEAESSEFGVRSETGVEKKSKTTITITPADGFGPARAYRVVLLCDTLDSRTRGLQGFRPLERDEAALFVFDKPRAPTFWMGRVKFPIDIIFVGLDKKVVRIYRDCKPGSRDYYPSGQPLKWVIETAAGSGISVGDRVRIE